MDRAVPGAAAAAAAAAGDILIENELRLLEAEFADWHAFLSDRGRWWATRTRGRRPPADDDTSWALTVDADNADGLRSQLARQAALTNPGWPRETPLLPGVVPARAGPAPPDRM